MTIADLFAGFPNLTSQLAVLALRGLVVGTLAGLTLTAFRVKSASVRLFAWTTVLYGALALPILGWILPPVVAPVALRAAKPAEVVRPAFVETVYSSTPASDFRLPASGKRVTLPAHDEHRESFWHLISWSLIAIWVYFGVMLLLLGRLGVGVVMTRRLRHAAKIVADAIVEAEVRSSAQALSSASLPDIAESEAVTVPVTVGVLRPVILLPANWREWDRAKLAAVIGHEASHVGRRDALTQNLALLYRAAFWFSPFAWWLQRHLAELAEQASDEAVLRSGADCTNYARTLLGFFAALQAEPGRVWWQGVAMVKAGQAERRVEKILGWRGAFGMGMKRSIAVVIIMLAIPVMYLSAAVCAQQPAPRLAAPTAPAARALPAPAAAPSAAPEPGAAPNPALAPTGSGPLPALAPSGVPPVAPASIAAGAPPTPPAALAADAPVTARADQSTSSYHLGNGDIFGEDDDQRFVIVRGSSESMTMSGSSEDARHAEKLRKKISGDFIWFERDEKSYIIRDQATVDRALKLWAPQEALGKQQEELGKQQEALGKQQEQLGKRMEEVRVKVPDMTAQLDKLRAEMKELSAGATQEQIGRLQTEIGELQSKIGEIQSQAGDQQSKLGEEMGALGEQQGKLGAQQGELGRQQGEMAREAMRQLRELLDEALKNGKAQPEPGIDDHGTL